MENYISKKELLVETGISYGQLYRWKRKGLIPESWFVRRSTFTGQETFFPREAILERVRWIQGAKTETALDDLAESIQSSSLWQEGLPADVLWRVAGLPNPGSAASMTRWEFFGQWTFHHLPDRERHAIGREAWAGFLGKLPPDWLEYPAVHLYGVPGVKNWTFFGVQSPESVCLGGEQPLLSVALGSLWQEAKGIWDKARMTVAAEVKGVRNT